MYVARMQLLCMTCTCLLYGQIPFENTGSTVSYLYPILEWSEILRAIDQSHTTKNQLVVDSVESFPLYLQYLISVLLHGNARDLSLYLKVLVMLMFEPRRYQTGAMRSCTVAVIQCPELDLYQTHVPRSGVRLRVDQLRKKSHRKSRMSRRCMVEWQILISTPRIQT